MISVKKKFSHLGFSIIFYLVISNLIGGLATFLYSFFASIFAFAQKAQSGVSPDVLRDPRYIMQMQDSILPDSHMTLILSMIPAYFICVPLTLLVLNAAKYRDVPLKGLTFSTPYEKSLKRDLTPKEFLGAFVMIFGLGILGNYIGTGIAYLMKLITGINMSDILVNSLGQMNLLETFIYVVILAPLFEEILYRYGLVGYCRRYGEWNAVIVSGVVFGFVHTNLFQFFYTFMIGAFLGYIYIYTRQLKYTIALHMLFNFFGGFIPTAVTNYSSSEVVSTLVGVVQCIFGCLGCILFILYIRSGKLFQTTPNSPVMGKVSKDTYLNAGMIFLMLICIALGILLQVMS